MQRIKRKIQFIKFDQFLFVLLAVVLVLHYTRAVTGSIDEVLLMFFASIATLPVFVSGYRSVKNKKISVDLLASVALIVSILSRQWASAVFINLMLTSARIFDAYTQNRSRNAIRSLLNLRPEKVKVKRGKNVVEESVAKIKKGDLVIVELGDRVPVDGIVVSGQAQIDQSSLTGESVPVEKSKGEEVFSSTLNVFGSLIIQAEKVGKDTTFEKVIRLVEQSQKDKIAIQTTADKFTSWYIALTFLGTIVLFTISHDIKLVLAVLLVTCADDIAVAIPMAYSAAIGGAARSGIIVKGASYLEGLTQVKTIITDKTGTLTRGKLVISKVAGFDGKKERDVVALAASADCFSEHPVAQAVIQYANKKKIPYEKIQDFKESPGLGISALLKKQKIFCGKLGFLEKSGVKISEEKKSQIEKMNQKQASSLLYVASGKELAGVIFLDDEIRPEAKKAIQELYALGIKDVVMLTGDNEKVAKKVSRSLGISRYHSNLFPEDKLKYLKTYLGKYGKVAMIGDGVNDAASLALADIGIAMGTIGVDSAIEAADVALMKDDFSKIPEAIRLGRMVRKISHEDFWIWGIVNALGLALVFARVIGPEGAAAFNFITDFFPLLNSLRLFEYRFRRKS